MLCSIDSVNKGIRWPVSHDCITGSSIQLIKVTYFLKLSTDQLLVLIDRWLNYFRSFILIQWNLY